MGPWRGLVLSLAILLAQFAATDTEPVTSCFGRDFLASRGGQQQIRGSGQILRLRGGKASELGGRLQNLGFMMRNDPEGYIPEMETAFRQWYQHRGFWEQAPHGAHKEFGELSVFLAQNQVKFPVVLHEFPGLLTGLLRGNHTSMSADLRMKMCEAVAIAAGRKAIPVTDMCGIFFKMFHLPEKKLRQYLYASSLSAIKRLNANSVDQVANRALQVESL